MFQNSEPFVDTSQIRKETQKQDNFALVGVKAVTARPLDCFFFLDASLGLLALAPGFSKRRKCVLGASLTHASLCSRQCEITSSLSVKKRKSHSHATIMGSASWVAINLNPSSGRGCR